MDDRPIEIVLQDVSPVERPESKDLRYKALEIIKTSTASSKTLTNLPDILLDLLTSVIKPLFSESLHPKLTSTGRKVLVKNSLPDSIVDRFSTFQFDDGSDRPLWKNGWTPQLLVHVLSRYADINCVDDDESQELRKKTIEGHFYLLMPPILKQLDDIQVSYKASGCRCLQLLCTTLHDSRSRILKQSGLMNVFIEALKNDFSMLPTLTPEDESLELYTALYPAYRALVRAFCGGTSAENPSSVNMASSEDDPDDGKRQHYLTLLLRHQLIHGLVHLSAGIGTGSTTSVPLSTLLISQIGWIVSDMGLSSTVHLQNLLPLLRNILGDPFGADAPGMLLETVKALHDIVKICWPRIKEKWWGECFRGIVTCWLNIHDNEVDLSLGKDTKGASRLKEVKKQLQIVSCLLEDIVGPELRQIAKRVVLDTPQLANLFTFPSQQEVPGNTVETFMSEIES